MLLSLLVACQQSDEGTMRTQSLKEKMKRTADRATSKMGDHRNRSVYVDQKAATVVAKTSGAVRAYVLIGDTNAYVALDTERKERPTPFSMNPSANRMIPQEGERIAPDVRKRIEKQMRQFAPHVQNVYISANRNAYEQLNLYGERFRPNQVASPALMEQFNRYVHNVFRAP